MVTIWHKDPNPTLRKCIAWLETHKIDYKTRDLRSDPLTYNDILNLTKTKNFVDLFSTKSKALKHINIYDLSYKEACNMLINTDKCLRTPIITNSQHTKIVIGFQNNELRTFIPKTLRKKEMLQVRKVLNNA